MSGTVTGGKRAAQTIKASEPDFYKRIGRIGGANGRGHAFGHGLVDPHEAGRKGGRLSKRYSKNPKPSKNKAVIVKDEETEMTPAELKELFGTQEPELTRPKLFNIRKFF